MGKGGQKKLAPADAPAAGGKKEVLIDGRFYDVTNMKHPGGSVINYYVGEGADATQAYNEFHIRSKRAKKFLDALPSRPAEKKELPKLPGQQALLDDFNKLHRDCKLF
jgi:cytochrome b involved in lipid metabolism